MYQNSNKTNACTLNDLPKKDIQVPPPAFLYPSFGQFLDHIRDCPEEADDGDLTKLETTVEKLSSLICQFARSKPGDCPVDPQHDLQLLSAVIFVRYRISFNRRGSINRWTRKWACDHDGDRCRTRECNRVGRGRSGSPPYVVLCTNAQQLFTQLQ